MKEWALKHPIMTFLLVDSLITGVLKTINAFAPKKTVCPAAEAEDGGEENDAVEVTVEVPEIEVEVEDKEETK